MSSEVPEPQPLPPVFFDTHINPKGVEAEYISIQVLHDRVHRQATDEDRVAYAHYRKNPALPSPPTTSPVPAKTEEAIRAEDAPTAYADLTPTEKKMEAQLEELAGTAEYTEKERKLALDEKTPVDSPMLRTAFKSFRKKK